MGQYLTIGIATRIVADSPWVTFFIMPAPMRSRKCSSETGGFCSVQ